MEDKLNWGANDQQITKKKTIKNIKDHIYQMSRFPKTYFLTTETRIWQ